MSGTAKTPGLRVEADHRDVDADFARRRILPFGRAEIERRRLRHIGSARTVSSRAGGNCHDSAWKSYLLRSDQQIEAHVVVDQHAALRHRDEKAELDKNQQDGNEDAATASAVRPFW